MYSTSSNAGYMSNRPCRKEYWIIIAVKTLETTSHSDIRYVSALWDDVGAFNLGLPAAHFGGDADIRTVRTKTPNTRKSREFQDSMPQCRRQTGKTRSRASLSGQPCYRSVARVVSE